MVVDSCPAPAHRHQGLFLFFLLGLFMLQVVFAFTIHGDIGPRPLDAGTGTRVAPPLLVGRVDAILAARGPAAAAVAVPCRPAPVPAPAPAARIPLPLPTLTAGAGPTAPASPGVEAVGERFASYQVRAGDTLGSIARRLYGSGRMVAPLVRLNRLRDEHGLRVGQLLKVPRKGLRADG